MTKNTPLARAVRTFAHLMVGVLLAAGTVDWIKGGADVRLAAVQLALGVVGALVAAIVAYVYAVIPTLPNAQSAFTKAIATFLQGLAGGLSTVALADVTGAAAISFGQSIVKVVVASAFAGLWTLAQNAAEDASAPAPA